MDEKTTTEQSTMVSPAEKSIPASSEVVATEHRTAYGTARTENLRDSGMWRYILPAFVILLCLAILAVLLLILIPLFVNSLDVTSHMHSLTWLWLTLIVLVVGCGVLISYGVLTMFCTQVGK